MKFRMFLAALCLAGQALGGPATEALKLNQDQSMIAVVTRKEGLASALAHEHFVIATQYESRIAWDGSDHASAVAEVTVQTGGLVPDPQGSVWGSYLKTHGILPEIAKVSGGDATTILENLQSDSQLDVAKHPTIKAALTNVKGSGDAGTATMRLTVKSVTVEVPVTLKFARTATGLVADLRGKTRFSDFGIKPFSAMLGAIRVADEFELVAHLDLSPVSLAPR